ncbi:Zn-ribbon domain-containing OB-fold protein [Mycobacterium intracellulare]|uniref:OB-fold domain-containing protein n=1 Tax=Mycobacterium intracellulare TaxID=1767 RepID=A0AAE4RD06_MYCIT|nr:OB-fold domain-containing protein [Mycobacterium intracellulare]MDV6976955.1 OB-fold domain-containing protein [Mycobacterium intracellulare]MDV6982252.1 OB-fold domain-containing protein [Mycobacterium intracellulare]MDV7011963.1 OB-fold domain-containing protein [Mycobacterium intracellulare]MDV7026899.1 OB-fold domain-containing protein [Mycobacterium intracellulare]
MTATAVEDWLLDSALAPAADDDMLAPLYRAAARNELALPFCAACALPLELDQEVCDQCGNAEQDWRTVDPRGTVHATTLMHRREGGLVRSVAPYPIVDVELTSGHRIVMTTVQPADTAPPIGTAVRIGFRHLGDIAIPAIDILEDQ